MPCEAAKPAIVVYGKQLGRKLSTIDSLTDDKLSGFCIRLALAGHRGTPREGEFDFLAEAENVFTTPPPAEKEKPKKAKKPKSLKKKIAA